MGRQRGDLFYFLQTSKATTPSIPALSSSGHNSSTAFVSSSVKNVNADVWHFRLGHLPQFRLSLLYDVLPSITCNSTTVCTVCPLARQRRLSFPISSSVSSSIFDLIHVDIWGPFSVHSINGSSFFLTIVDDFSRFTWVYLLQSKAQVRNLIQSFYHFIKTQFQLRIKVVRSDHGAEFFMPNFYSAKGIIHQLSCVETPQQNSVVE
jgi:hypothetical protein